MRLVTTKAETRAILDVSRASGRRVGFVPTMGFLHDGHVSLIERARAENDVVVVSIFVNPLQFGPQEDLVDYPRDLDRDLTLCESAGVDVVFHPSVEEMYGPVSASPIKLVVGSMGEVMCGRTRPGHFDGVATVVAKLLNIVGPCRAYFGEKDAQQLVILRRLVHAFDFPVEVVGCPIVRQPDGLALSSRNVYLPQAAKVAARVLKGALDEGFDLIRRGERMGGAVAAGMAARISSEPLARLDYAVCVDPDTLDDLARIEGRALLAVAAWFGKARLIDNMTVTPAGASIEGST